MADLILDVDYDVTEAEAKQRKLDRELEISRKKAENIKNEIGKTKQNIEDSIKRQKEYNKELDRSSQKLEEYRKGNTEFSKQEFQAELKNNEQIMKKIAQEEKYQQSQEKSLAKRNLALNTQNAKTADIGNKIFQNTKKQNKFSQAFEKSTKSADRFGRRLKSLIASALFFSLVTKAFTALRNEFGKLITETGSKTAALVAKLNENLAVLGRTLYEGAKPYIEWFLEKLVNITYLMSTLLAKALGKDINEMKKLANATKNVSKNAEKTTASFDTLQTIGSIGKNDLASGKTDTILPPNDNELQKTKELLKTIWDYVQLIASGLIAWKLTGFLSDLGLVSNKFKTLLGLSIAIYSAIEFTEYYSDAWVNGIDWENFIGLLVSLIGVVFGLRLAFGNVGAAIGLVIGGITLVVLGIKDMVDNGINAKNLIVIAIGAISSAFGILLLKTKSVSSALKLLFSPTGTLVMGISILVAGIGYLAKNWDKLSPAQRTITILGSLTAALTAAAVAVALFHTSWTVGVAAAAIVGGIALLAGTYLFKTANQKGINTNLSSKGTVPTSISQYANLTKGNPIPALATGAILPGGSPMLAWVNDQPKGKTYVEGSVENIAAAFEKYLGGRTVGNQNITLEAKGNWAQFLKWMNLQIKQEDDRASIWG